MEGLTLFQAVLTVLGVLVLAYYCSHLLGKQWGKTSQSGSMRVLEHIQVGQNQKILLLKVKDKVYLVGVSQAGIRLLTELEGDFQTTGLLDLSGRAQPPFQELLEKYLMPHKKKGGDTDE
ncbi:MAG: flagellar biosynthetic protein FliO [Lachnospiraceae bacterium]|jgi:flagellar protein FliO/FliZ|nr:flagellar biosynthetic protein FliO [Lachnospiraceae bacterium]